MNWPENGPRILVFGNRGWSCLQTIEAWLLPIQAQWIKVGATNENAPTVIHGMADGADKIAHEVAFRLGFNRKPYPVPRDEWERSARVPGICAIDAWRKKHVRTWVSGLVSSRKIRARSIGPDPATCLTS